MIHLTEEHREIREMVCAYADNELRPRAAEADEHARFPAESLRELGGLGLFGASLPESYGGTGGNLLTLAIVLEELGRACASTALVAGTHAGQAALAILAHGTEEQKLRLLPALATGSQLATVAIAEPAADGDDAWIQTRARRAGDGWKLSGTKMQVVAARAASLFVVAARTDEAENGTDGLALFLVEGGSAAPGIAISAPHDLLGARAAGIADVDFADCKVPAAALLGGKEKNYPALRDTLNLARISVAAVAAGVARGAESYARDYSRKRHAFGGPISRFEALRKMMAETATAIAAATLLVYRAASRYDAKEPCDCDASMCKLAATHAAYLAGKSAVQILGGNGFSREFPVERMYRDGTALAVIASPPEIHRLHIAQCLLGEGSA